MKFLPEAEPITPNIPILLNEPHSTHSCPISPTVSISDSPLIRNDRNLTMQARMPTVAGMVTNKMKNKVVPKLELTDPRMQKAF